MLGRETSVHTLYGERYEGKHGTVVTDHYEGHVGISTTDLSRGWVRGDSNYTMEVPEGTCFVQATLDMHSDAEAFHVTTPHPSDPAQQLAEGELAQLLRADGRCEVDTVMEQLVRAEDGRPLLQSGGRVRRRR